MFLVCHQNLISSPHPNIFDARYPVHPLATLTYFFLVEIEVGTTNEKGRFPVGVNVNSHFHSCSTSTHP